jgi:hypothetical protein
MVKKKLYIYYSSISYLIGSILWFLSLFLHEKNSIIFYDKLAALFYVIGSILLLL